MLTRLRDSLLEPCARKPARTVLRGRGSRMATLLPGGRSVAVVSERNTTRVCSFCGALTGPTGKDMLVVRHWECPECGAGHDRDENAARNILYAGLRRRASMCGNELSHDIPFVEPEGNFRARYGWGACYVAA